MRACGNTYKTISSELGIATRTLMNWSKELANDISNERAMELEGLNDRFMIGRQQQLQIAGSQLGKITQEMLKRDLSEVPTAKLFDMQQKLAKEVAAQVKDVAFIEETKTDGLHKLDNMYKKVDKWVG